MARSDRRRHAGGASCHGDRFARRYREPWTIPGAPARQRGAADRALVRLGYLPHTVGTMRPRLDAGPLRLLDAGRMGDAGALLLRRLAANGLRAKVRLVAGDGAFARRLAASVAIPISTHDYGRLLG